MSIGVPQFSEDPRGQEAKSSQDQALLPEPRLHRAYLRNSWYLNDRTKHFEFETRNDDLFDYLPGQYISMEVEIEGRLCTRSYSVASSPHHDNRFDLCLNIIPSGLVSPYLFHLQPGDFIEFTGPFGDFGLRQPLDPVSVFVAVGTGISPIRSMLQYIYQQPPLQATIGSAGEVWLLYGVRDGPDILYRDEFEHMQRDNPALRFIPTLSRARAGWTGHTGYVEKLIARYLKRKQGLHAYICGLKRMVNDVCEQLRDMGHPEEALSYEKYD